MNNLAESLARSLRSFRKKAEAIGRSENNNGVRPEVMRDLQRELALTVKELGRGSKSAERDGGSASSTGDDDMMAMLETYSSKLLSMVNDRLEEQFQRKDGEEVTVKTNGTSPTTTNDVSDEANSELDRRKAGGAEVTGEG
jgi:hypothetical protein